MSESDNENPNSQGSGDSKSEVPSTLEKLRKKPQEVKNLPDKTTYGKRDRSESTLSAITVISDDLDDEQPSTPTRHKETTSNQSEDKTDSKKEVTFSTLPNFFAGFTAEESAAEEEFDHPISPPSMADSLHSPLLASSTMDSLPPSSSADIKTTKDKPTTVKQILNLTHDEINKLFFDTIEETKENPKANKYLSTLFALLIAAALSDINFSLWLRGHIQENLIFLFSKGGSINDLAPEVVDGIIIFSWILASFNLAVDLLAVNPAEGAFKLFNSILDWLNSPFEFSTRKACRFIIDALFFYSVGTFISSAAMNGFPETGVKPLDTAIESVILLLQMLYFGMFSYLQFGKHLDAAGELLFSLVSQILSCLVRIPAPEAKTKKSPPTFATAEEKSKPSNFEKFQEIATVISMCRFLGSTYIFRIMSAMLPFIQLLTEKFGMSDGITKTRIAIITAVVSFIGAVMMRTRQPLLKTYNKEFSQLNPEEIRKAEVGWRQHFSNSIVALSSGWSVYTLFSHNMDKNKKYRIPVAVTGGLLSTAITGSAFHRTSKRTAALEAKKKQAALINEFATKNSRLQQILVMEPGELFDEVVKKVKTGSNWASSFTNFMARASRFVAFGNFINESGKPLGINIPIDYTNQGAATVYLATPIGKSDLEAFDVELNGEKREDADGHIPYLQAKYRITGGGRNFLLHLATPKEHFEFLPTFKTYCELDPASHETYERFKQSISELVPITEQNEDNFILKLRKHAKAEYAKTIQRLSDWISQPEMDKFIKRLKRNPEFLPYIQTFQSPSSKPNFGFIGKDFPILKTLENRLFQSKMGILIQDKWEDNQKPEDRRMIDDNQYVQVGDFSISQEALDLIERFEKRSTLGVQSPVSEREKDPLLNKTSSTINDLSSSSQRFFLSSEKNQERNENSTPNGIDDNSLRKMEEGLGESNNSHEEETQKQEKSTSGRSHWGCIVS
ncbi:MAG TPA: hypothetical protein VHE99_00750 [Gammaproteobacteria bacterium]|nr:hypothetical protein [Gammaproteobacteria bacterium]